MRTLAILPVKSFVQAKQRLAGELPEGPRRALTESMFADVLTALRRTPVLDGILVVTSELTAERLAAGHGVDVVDDPREDGQNAAALLGIARARELGYERVILVPGDCPALDPAELEALLGRPRAGARDVLIVPDRHGKGTNGLVLSPPDALEPAFGTNSRERHETNAAAAGATHAVVEVSSLALDVDTPADLTALRERFAAVRGGGAHTRGLLNQLARASVSA
jgi:2-phospho-L-lactate/phosphoenolpyruvate guanylyltransferase